MNEINKLKIKNFPRGLKKKKVKNQSSTKSHSVLVS